MDEQNMSSVEETGLEEAPETLGEMEGQEESAGVAAPGDAEGAESETANEENATPQPEADQHEQNEMWRNRRLAEREKGYKQAYAEMDTWAVQMYGDFVSPVTGKNISSFKEYQEALSARREAQRNAQIAEEARKGNDVSALINEAVQNAPAVRQANEWMAAQQQAERDRKNVAYLKEIVKLDPSLNGDPRNISKIAELDDFNDLCAKGVDPVDAYRYACMERLSKTAQQSRDAAIRQNAINQAKGTSHIKTTQTGNAGENTGIPESEITNMMSFRNMSRKEAIAAIKRIM